MIGAWHVVAKCKRIFVGGEIPAHRGIVDRQISTAAAFVRHGADEVWVPGGPSALLSATTFASVPPHHTAMPRSCTGGKGLPVPLSAPLCFKSLLQLPAGGGEIVSAELHEADATAGSRRSRSLGFLFGARIDQLIKVSTAAGRSGEAEVFRFRYVPLLSLATSSQVGRSGSGPKSMTLTATGFAGSRL